MAIKTLRIASAMSVASALLIAAPAMASTPSPSINYTMHNTLSGLAGNPVLVAAPTCSNPNTEDICNTSTNFGSDSNGNYFHWVTTQGNGGGLTLTTASRLGDSYSFTLKFAITVFSNDEDGQSDAHNGYSKLVDFNDLANDDGLYYNNFAPHHLLTNYSGDSADTFATDEVVTMTVVRDASDSSFKVYTKTGSGDPVLQFNEDDSNGLYIASDSGSGSVLHLFQDENEDAGQSHEGVQEGRLYGFEAWPGVALTEAQVASAPSGSSLANTGSESGSQALLGGSLLAAGIALQVVARRRRTN